MLKTCGYYVHSLWVQLVQLRDFIPTPSVSTTACAEASSLYHQLSNFCTQLIRTLKAVLTSVFRELSALYTGPIITITIYI